MEQSSSSDELTIRHRFDRLCHMAIKGEYVNFCRHMEYLREHEISLEFLSETNNLNLYTEDDYDLDYHRFQVYGYDILIKDALLAEALSALTERKRSIILMSYFLGMSDVEIAKELQVVRSAVNKHKKISLKQLKELMKGECDVKNKKSKKRK